MNSILPRISRILPATMSGLLVAIGVVPPSLQAQEEIERGALPAMPAATYHPEPPAAQVDTFAAGLEILWELEFAPDGRLFVAEQMGNVLTFSPEGVESEEPWLSLEDDMYLVGESGLMGMALHPNFEEEPWVYVMYSIQGVEGGPFDRVSRFLDDGGQAGDEEILIDRLPEEQTRGNNRGGTIAFGPDGMLYVSVGENFQRDLAADPEVPHGSVLRVTPEGEVPDDNPLPGNPVWAYGLRNVHGMAWHPETGDMWVADHGPSGEDGIRGHDRILILQEGGHHGWPAVVGATGREEYVDPILVFEDPAPPGDLAFFDGDLYMSVLGFDPVGTKTLMRIAFDDPNEPLQPTALERWFNDEDGNARFGRLRGMTVGPDGALYVGTSNRDGRSGYERGEDGDDRILRITPQ